MKGCEYFMTDEEFYRIYTFLKSRYGIDMGRKKEIVVGRMEHYIKMKGYPSYTAYMNVLEKDITGNLEKELVNLLTTNHTFFMREHEHFDYLKQIVLPWLRQKEAKNKDLCIWCGAASTGEEPYTLAMIMKDFFGLEHHLWNTEILATDISTEVLRQAIRGKYTREQIDKIPQAWKNRYFREDINHEFEVSEESKKEVIFRQFNLMDPFPFKRKMHIVFLRNVMIYFDSATKRQLIQKVYDVMEPGGYLFIGRTEVIDRKQIPFQFVRPSIFRK